MNSPIPGWMAAPDLKVMADLAARIPENGAIVEVGSWLGQSTYTWATSTKATVYAIDLWKWMPKEYCGPGHERVNLAGDPFAQFHANVGHLPNVVPMRRNSSGGVWDQGPIDLVFIDAMHQNPWVGEDVRYWEEHVKPGGVICGDDYSPRFPAVMEEAQACACRHNVSLELPGQKFWLVRKPA